MAEGLTNQQAGARMFVSRHTVDFHLRQIFRKLGITSRVMLAGVVLGRSADPRDRGMRVSSLRCDAAHVERTIAEGVRMTASERRTTMLGMSRPSPELVRTPDLAREAAQTLLEEARHEAQDVPEQGGPHQPAGNLFLPIERATDEFQQTFGRRPSIYEVAAGVASRPDLVEPVHRAALRWPRRTAPGVADSWFLTESVGDRARLELERAAIAGALLECLEDWEEQVMRSRVEPHMTQLEITHALAYSQLRACIALMRGLERLDAALMSPME